MDVPLQHVIGTVALIGLVVSVSMAYQATVSYIEANVYKSQLGEIAENVALSLVEVIRLTEFGGVSKNQTLIKVTNLPTDLNEKAYLIRLIEVDEGNVGKRLYVQAELVTRADIYSRAIIPISPNSTNIKILVNNRLDVILGTEGTLLVKLGEGGTVKYSGFVYGGANFAVWSWGYNSTLIFAGIGRWSPPGGL